MFKGITTTILTLSFFSCSFASGFALVDTISSYMTIIGTRCVKEKKVPGNILKKPIYFGAYGVFEKKGDGYELKQKWDDEDAEPGRGTQEGLVMGAKFPYIKTIIDPSDDDILDIGLAKAYQKGQGLDDYIPISKNQDSYFLLTKRFITEDNKKEFLVIGLFFEDQYFQIIPDMWEKKENIKYLSYDPEVFRKLSGLILAAKNNDIMSFYTLNGTIQDPGTALKRKLFLESGDADKLRNRFEQDKASLFNKKYIVLISTHPQGIIGRPPISFIFNNQYDLNNGSFSIEFDGDLICGLLDLETAFPVKWDIPRENIITPADRKAMISAMGRVYQEMGLAKNELEDKIEYFDPETKQQARDYVFTCMAFGAYDQFRKIQKGYTQKRTGKLELKVPAKAAQSVDGNGQLHVALVFKITSDTTTEPINNSTLFKCTDGEIRILNKLTLGKLLSVAYKN